MTTLKDFTVEDLKQELARRNLERPNMLVTVSLSDLKGRCQEYIDYLCSSEYHEDALSDWKQSVFEAAMMMFYGDDVWEWINERMG